jgi:TRAP transporter TAXI family solute receptor
MTRSADAVDETVGSAIPTAAIVATLVAVVVLIGGFAFFRTLSRGEERQEIVIATGVEGGAYHALGSALARLLEESHLVASAAVRATEGSVSNMGLIGTGAADLALVQSDTPPHERARLIALLHQEALHILVAKDRAAEIRDIHDLDGRNVALGALGSGTRQVAQRVLDHFGVEVGADFHATPAEAIDSVANGSIDAIFLLTAIPAPSVKILCDRDLVRFLPLGSAQEVGNEADALALVHPSLANMTIPRSTYGSLPVDPVQTVSVTAQLIASSELDARLVHAITGAIFQHRTRLDGIDPSVSEIAKRIRERYQPGDVELPYHSGAVAYYERAQPPFLVEYAESISLGLTLLVGAYSGWIALREWLRRRRKNRIDAYYVEAVEHAVDPAETDLAVLRERRAALVQLRRRAFADLVAEKLDADDSFAILQDHIAGELEMIAARISTAQRSS